MRKLRISWSGWLLSVDKPEDTPGCSIGFYIHGTGSEIIYILRGKADFLHDDGTEETAAGGCHSCPGSHSRSGMNRSDEKLVCFAVVPEQ